MLTVLIEAEKTSLRPNFSITSAENLTEAPSFSLSGLSPHKLLDLPDQSLSHSYSSETSPSPRLSSTNSSGNQFFQKSAFHIFSSRQILQMNVIQGDNGENFSQFLSDPGIPGVRSMENTLCRLN